MSTAPKARKVQIRFFYDSTWTRWYDTADLPDISGLQFEKVEIIEEVTREEYEQMQKEGKL